MVALHPTKNSVRTRYKDIDINIDIVEVEGNSST
jgi:hypothetical protein